MATRAASPVGGSSGRESAANVGVEGEDARAADAAIERALHGAVVAGLGFSVRGTLGTDVTARLEHAGLSAAAASRIAGLLQECEAARFAPVPADIETVRERWTRAAQAIREIEKMVNAPLHV